MTPGHEHLDWAKVGNVNDWRRQDFSLACALQVKDEYRYKIVGPVPYKITKAKTNAIGDGLLLRGQLSFN